MHFIVHPGAAAFLEAATPWLLEREAENNLILGVADRVAREESAASGADAPVPGGDAPDSGAEAPDLDTPLFGTVHHRDRIVGAFSRTPPMKVGLTPMPPEAAESVVEAVAGRWEHIPGVLGPREVATAVAETWVRRKGGTVRTGMRQGIYELTELVEPASRPAGESRLATAEDLPTLVSWMTAFADEVGVGPRDPEEMARRAVEEERFLVWEVGALVSVAGWSARTPNGYRIGYVFTPPAHRGRGYATALVADLTRSLLDGGARFCFLYTDLSNPTSNAIYRRLGYRQVAEVVDVWIEEGREARRS